MATPLPRVRVVVLNWNAAWLTARCVRSVLATDYPADRWELVVVDNASIDDSLPRLRRLFPGVRFLENPANLGFAEGNNRAMRDLDGFDAVALVNNDATVEPSWLRELVAVFQADERVGAVAPKILLEHPTVAIRVEGSATIETVEVDGIDVTRRSIHEGANETAHPTVPLRLLHRYEGSGTIHVPVAADSRAVTIRSSGVLHAVDPHARGSATSDGCTLVIDVPPERTIRINSLGTELTPWTEGSERWFGVDDRPHLAPHEVWGFSGGGVLLRTEMLADVGLFDPAWFAYYEDTDLAWRARRAGWTIVCAPDAVVHHLHGGSAGPEATGFFFLNYRNWLLTVVRNGSPRQVVAAFRTATRLAWGPFRRNVFGRLRRGWRPDLRITAAWMRVAAGVGVLLPRTAAARFGGRRPGADETDVTPSRLMPATPPRGPAARLGGPRIVYVDVTETLRSGWRAGIQRVVCGLVRTLPEADERLDVVAIVWDPVLRTFRRVDRDEYASLLAPAGRGQPAGPPPPPGTLRRIASRVMHLSGLAPLVYWKRRRAELAAVPERHRMLVVDRFAPGSVFFDVDATWNPTTRPRSELLAELVAGGVQPVLFVHDVIPLRHPEWFPPNLVEVFRDHLHAHLAAGSSFICNSEHSRSDLVAYAAEHGWEVDAAVTPLAGEPRSHLDVDDTETDDRPPVFLAVGTVEPRKGHAVLLDAIELVRREHPEARLHVIGRPGWNASELIDRLRSGVEGVVWNAAASDEDLEAAYREATAVVVASATEGFGLPVVEALVRGVPVISSDGGALPEASGGHAVHVPAGDASAFAEAMLRHLDDDGFRREQRRLARSFTPRTWHDVASSVAAELLPRRGDPADPTT